MQATTEKYTLYYHTGCSSCVRTKEFLLQAGVDFVAIDTLQDPEGYEQLLQLGVRYVPVVAKGKRYVRGQNLEDVAEFLGLHGSKPPLLSPQELVGKWLKILRRARDYVSRISDDSINQNAQPTRNRTLRMVSHHIFNIAETYLDCISNDGAKNLTDILERPLKAGTYLTSAEIVHYGDEVIARLEQWWNALADKSCRKDINTFYKDRALSMHQLLERSTWHSAHHARQIADVLERRGIDPGVKFTPAELAGLPMPERLWD